MSNKIVLELSPNQVEELVERLSMQEKIKLVNRLERETLRQRWNNILRNIDRRLKQFPISEKGIAKEIESYRREKYAKSRN